MPLRLVAASLFPILACGCGTEGIQIALSWSADPADLDAHLTFPESDGVRGHVYYGDEQEGDVSLDTDASIGWGSEVVTARALVDGVYRYSVHQYGGAGTLSTSGAAVTMTADRLGAYAMAAPAGGDGDGDAWLCWDIVVSGGRATEVRSLDRIVPGVSPTDDEAFSP